jgi:ketosteroid isomerase-like protein
MHDVTTDPTILLDSYVAAWNEADPERRRAAVGRLYADDARIVAPSVEVRGSEAILEHIGEVFARFVGPGEQRFHRTADTGHHRSLLLHWELTGGGLPAASSGWNVLVLDANGRIEADLQFSEPQPTAPEAGASGR